MRALRVLRKIFAQRMHRTHHTQGRGVKFYATRASYATQSPALRKDYTQRCNAHRKLVAHLALCAVASPGMGHWGEMTDMICCIRLYLFLLLL